MRVTKDIQSVIQTELNLAYSKVEEKIEKDFPHPTVEMREVYKAVEKAARPVIIRAVERFLKSHPDLSFGNVPEGKTLGEYLGDLMNFDDRWKNSPYIKDSLEDKRRKALNAAYDLQKKVYREAIIDLRFVNTKEEYYSYMEQAKQKILDAY
jgi:hypothetical protein